MDLRSHVVVFVFAITVLSSQLGCATMHNGRSWGQDATLIPNEERVRRAATRAFMDPATWTLLIGAAAIASVDRGDTRLSNWASTRTPIFGSQKAAGRTSDVLASVLLFSAMGTGVLAPSGKASDTWLASKAKGTLVHGAALGLTLGVTGTVKLEANRLRPDESNSRSFPSGHTSSAFACASLASRNVDSFAISEGGKTAFRVGFTTLALGVGWARIEAQRHYPTDVLVGAALGNVVASFF